MHRGDADFQGYRLILEKYTWQRFDSLMTEYSPDVAINEIIPAVGGGNFTVATQSYLVNCVVTTFHNVAHFYRLPIKQISARTVHKQMVGPTKQGQKVTKVQVRNAVLNRLPELRDNGRGTEWVKSKVFDESDAVAIGLCY